MPRKPRKAPERVEEALDIYSTWDIRVARLFYYSFVLAAIIIMLGTWISLIAGIPFKIWDWYLSLDVGFQVAIIGAIITAHLLVLVLFYAMFRGGIYRMCRVLYKNRLVAKKYEDYTVLRWLVGVMLLGIYFTLFAVIIGILTVDFWTWLDTIWKWMVKTFNVGHWILWLGLVVLSVVIFFFFMFVIWNHIVFLVLRLITRTKEEEEIDIDIKKEQIRKLSEEDRRKSYRKETGKVATYRGRETRGYKSWKKKMGVRE